MLIFEDTKREIISITFNNYSTLSAVHLLLKVSIRHPQDISGHSCILFSLQFSLPQFHMNDPVVNPVTARCVGTIKVVALKGLRRRGCWNMTSWWIEWGGDLGSCWLDNTIYLCGGRWYNPKVSNRKGFSSQGFWLIQKKDNWVLPCFSESNNHGSSSIFIWPSISMSEMSERCFVQQRITAKKNARHQTCSRVETAVSSYESIWCLTK